jgi:putative DNA primase/helicase
MQTLCCESREEKVTETFRPLADRFSLIRLKGKEPVEKGWPRYCHLKRSFDEIKFRPGDNAGIACGPASGVIVLDVDDEAPFREACQQEGWTVPDTLTVRTGSGGRHHYFVYPEGEASYGNRSLKACGFDIRGVGGVAVVPGSIHPDTGSVYEFENDSPIASAPCWLVDLTIHKADARDTTLAVLPDPEETDLDSLRLSEHLRELIINRQPQGERSEAIMSALNGLVAAGLRDAQILCIFEQHAIGEKYHEKGEGRELWLLEQIHKARQYTLAVQPVLHPESVLGALRDSERGDSKLFISLYCNRFCYDHSLGVWFSWNGFHWEEDGTNEVLAAVDKVAEAFGREADRQTAVQRKALNDGDRRGASDAEDLEKILRDRKSRLQTLQRRRNVLILASSGADSLGITGDEWDTDPWLLGCVNGVINLRDGSFDRGKPELCIKTAAPTEWSGLEVEAPTFERFLGDVFQGNAELVGYMQRLLGYSILGETVEHVLPILWGQGRNGKGTLLELLGHVLGQLAGPIPSETLLDHKYAQSGASHTADLMLLRGRRIAWASETAAGRSFSEAKVKWLCGGDTINARPPHGKSFISFRPSHTLFLLTNTKPHASAEDFAFWKRVHLIPFQLSFVDDPKRPNERKRDAALIQKLKKEASGILAWLVRGCLAWQSHGLNPPHVVLDATESYREEEDTIGHFIEGCCLVAPDSQVKADALYQAYRPWCADNGHRPLSSTNFGKRMTERFTKRKSGCFLYVGVELNEGQSGPFSEGTAL